MNTRWRDIAALIVIGPFIYLSAFIFDLIDWYVDWRKCR